MSDFLDSFSCKFHLFIFLFFQFIYSVFCCCLSFFSYLRFFTCFFIHRLFICFVGMDSHFFILFIIIFYFFLCRFLFFPVHTQIFLFIACSFVLVFIHKFFFLFISFSFSLLSSFFILGFSLAFFHPVNIVQVPTPKTPRHTSLSQFLQKRQNFLP